MVKKGLITKELLDLGGGIKIKQIKRFKETKGKKMLVGSEIGIFKVKKLLHKGFKNVEEAKQQLGII